VFSGYEVWLEGDDMSVIQQFQGTESEGDSNMLKDARWLLRNSAIVKVSHVFCEGNQCAD